jgi:uncharacterized membrane protein YkvA (DUF1232 family)
MLWALVRGDATCLWYALQHPETPGWLKAGTALLVVYLVSPIDVVPDVVPVFGFVDDVVLVPLAIRWMLSHLPAHVRAWADRRANGNGSAGNRADAPGTRSDRRAELPMVDEVGANRRGTTRSP